MTGTMRIPDETHPITIWPAGAHVTVRVAGVVIAETDRALSLAEADYPVVHYIPLSDVHQSLLEPAATVTYCPYKGAASYYTVRLPDGTAEPDLLWAYGDPYPAVAQIAGHVACYASRAEITAGHS